jgi:hypothetical protein
MPPEAPAGRVGVPPAAGVLPGQRAFGATAGLAAIGLSVALTFTVAVLGPSIMEPPLPGSPGQPPWALAANPSPYLAVALTAAAIAAGTAGLALTLRAARRGWSVSPRLILAAGILAAVALALVPPFGSSDHLSYAAYGRMVLTGHDPYTTTPAALARLGDPVARAVEDWRNTPSVYGAVATAGQALASLIGGASARLTVFVLSLLNVAAFGVTGLLLHRLGRGDRRRQLRAALLWTCNPLLLQVLVAGAHVDSQAIVFGIAAVAVFVWRVRDDPSSPLSPWQLGLAAAGAGALIGLGFAVKVTMALVGAGLAVACLLAWRAQAQAQAQAVAAASGRIAAGQPGLRLRWRGLAAVLGGLAAGFGLTAGASLAVWGPSSLRPALRQGSSVSIGSPWRIVRSALHLAVSEGAAEDLVKAGAVVLAIVLVALLLRSVSAAGPGTWPAVPGLAGAAERPSRGEVSSGGVSSEAVSSGAAASGTVSSGPAASKDGTLGSSGPLAVSAGEPVPAGLAVWAYCAAFAVAFAWLLAWPYVLPWYDSLGWALLALLPASRLDWLMLVRTTGLALGYLPARGIVMPAGLGWLETVVRTAVTPVVLLAVTAALVVMLRPRRASLLPGQ